MVVEDAPSGIQAARAGGMLGLGVARLDDAALLEAAGADLVVTSLDEVAVERSSRVGSNVRAKTVAELRSGENRHDIDAPEVPRTPWARAALDATADPALDSGGVRLYAASRNGH